MGSDGDDPTSLVVRLVRRVMLSGDRCEEPRCAVLHQPYGPDTRVTLIRGRATAFNGVSGAPTCFDGYCNDIYQALGDQ